MLEANPTNRGYVRKMEWDVSLLLGENPTCIEECQLHKVYCR